MSSIAETFAILSGLYSRMGEVSLEDITGWSENTIIHEATDHADTFHDGKLNKRKALRS